MPAGSHPHDVAPAPDGTVWYTAQATGKLGRLDPATGQTTEVPLGDGSAPHGVIVGPDGAAWVTDGGLNAIVRVDPGTTAFRGFRLPASTGNANLNTATFDKRGILWFTGQNGIYGRLNPKTGAMRVFRAPLGVGAVRDHDDAEGSGLLRVARGKPHRADRRAHRQGDRHPAADRRPGRASRVVELEGADLGQRVERGQGRPLRPCHEEVARVGRPRPGSALRRLRRRQGRRLADRLRAQRASGASHRRRGASRACRSAQGRTCASCSGGRARCGAPSRAPTGSSSCVGEA